MLQKPVFFFFQLIVVFAVLCATFLSIVPETRAADCNPGDTGGVKLTDCFLLNPSTGTTVAGVYNKPNVLVNVIIKNIFIVAGLVLFFTIIYAGFLFISGGVKGQEQAATMFGTAITGLVLMFAAYWIMQIIRLVTGADIGF